jgi:hypothetical protein
MDTPTVIAALFHQLPIADRLNLGVRAPHPFLVTGEDRLRLTVRNGAAGVTVTLSGRFLTIEGEVRPLLYALTPTTDLVASTLDFALGDGWILNLTARASAGTPQIGDTNIVVDVIRGSGAAAIILGTLIAAFVTDAVPAAWPGSLVAASGDSEGTLDAIAGADPAAGAEWSIVVPAGARWRVRSVTAVLVASAAVANREPSIVFTADGLVVASVPSGVAHVASQTRRYSWFPSAFRGAAAASLDLAVPIPALELRGGDTITSVTTAIDVGDNWGAPVVYVER